MTAKTPEQRIADLGLSLPPAAGAVANYVPWAITGNLVMTSGNLPWRDGKLAYVGKIGLGISGEDGYKSCQLSCLNAIAQIKQAVGELWGRFLSKEFSTEPHDFVADGDKVVILTTVTLEGETVESADVSTYNADGKLVAFDTLGDPTIVNRVFPK